MLIEARGPWVSALKRHDPGLRVRWSYEHKKWVVEARALKKHMLAPPVVYEPIPGSQMEFREYLKPELSDDSIAYRDHMYVICKSSILDRRLFEAVVKRDAARFHGGFTGELRRQCGRKDAAFIRDKKKRSEERSYEAFDRLKHFIKMNPNAEDGTGVSLKGFIPKGER